MLQVCLENKKVLCTNGIYKGMTGYVVKSLDNTVDFVDEKTGLEVVDCSVNDVQIIDELSSMELHISFDSDSFRKLDVLRQRFSTDSLYVGNDAVIKVALDMLYEKYVLHSSDCPYCRVTLLKKEGLILDRHGNPFFTSYYECCQCGYIKDECYKNFDDSVVESVFSNE